MTAILLKNARIVNEDTVIESDLLIEGDRISQIGDSLSHPSAQVILADGKLLFPGVIDDQVHFREPGLTHKAEIATESAAAAAGGITSYMEMPNTVPQTLTQDLLQQKYDRAAQVSRVNYSFYMGASNDNLEEVLKTDPSSVCGVKIFMGSSTGDMLVDSEKTLRSLFKDVPLLIATHCEKEEIVRANTSLYKERFGDEIPFSHHPDIRSREACFASSSMAVQLAQEYEARLHVLHISTEDELSLFSGDVPVSEKKITAEACIHHLWFTNEDYELHGSRIKWNPAVKSRADREAIRAAVKSGVIDVVATDHAPHTLEEKSGTYMQAPSGGPLVQHSLVAMLELVKQGVFTLAEVVTRMCHVPAEMFQIEDRGFIREGYKADLVLVDTHDSWVVERENLLYKCGWSPFEGQEFSSRVCMTLVNGQIVFDGSSIVKTGAGERLSFAKGRR